MHGLDDVDDLVLFYVVSCLDLAGWSEDSGLDWYFKFVYEMLRTVEIMYTLISDQRENFGYVTLFSVRRSWYKLTVLQSKALF